MKWKGCQIDFHICTESMIVIFPQFFSVGAFYADQGIKGLLCCKLWFFCFFFIGTP